MSGVLKDSGTWNTPSQSVEFAGRSAADDKNRSGERAEGATLLTIGGFRDDPDEPLKGCDAADQPSVRPHARECNERPASSGRVKCLSPLMAGVLLVESLPNVNHISSIDPKSFDSAASSPGFSTGIRPRYCSLTLLRTASSPPQKT